MLLSTDPTDGALSLDRVKGVLGSHGVQLSERNGFTIMCKGDVIEVQRFTDPVNRVIIQRLWRLFDIPILHFYFDVHENTH